VLPVPCCSFDILCKQIVILKLNLVTCKFIQCVSLNLMQFELQKNMLFLSKDEHGEALRVF
jgi:hypothetical protein